MTRTSGSGRGFSPDLVVMDEAFNLSDDSMAATMFALSARPNPQLWYTSSAGMRNSEVLSRVRRRGLAGGDPQLAYFEWSASDDADLDDRAVWAQANPALGIRVTAETVESERLSMPDEQFGRERLGLWADEDQHVDVFDGAWPALADAKAERGVGQVFAVAVAPDRSWSAIAVAWRRPDGLAQVMLADYRPSTEWVSGRVSELRATWGGIVVASTAARGLVEDALEPNQAEQCRAHVALDDAVRASGVRHGNEAALNVSVRAARWKPYGDTRMLDRKGSLDISPLDAAALAYDGLSADDDSWGFFE